MGKGFGDGYFIPSSTLHILTQLVSSSSEVKVSRKERKELKKKEGM